LRQDNALRREPIFPATTPEDFLDDLAFELRLRGVPVFRSELRQWVQDAWPLIEPDPSSERGAAAYLELRPALAAEAD
jgi:hypothetical protein